MKRTIIIKLDIQYKFPSLSLTFNVVPKLLNTNPKTLINARTADSLHAMISN